MAWLGVVEDKKREGRNVNKDGLFQLEEEN
jgi:hypothetical protein